MLHFPGCTLTPNHNIYESFGFFCPLDSMDSVELIKNEDVLFDWSVPKYLNYTHVNLMDQLEEFFSAIGKVERIQGEVWVCQDGPDCLELGELPSNEAVKFFGRFDLFHWLNKSFLVVLAGNATAARRRRQRYSRLVSS